MSTHVLTASPNCAIGQSCFKLCAFKTLLLIITKRISVDDRIERAKLFSLKIGQSFEKSKKWAKATLVGDTSFFSCWTVAQLVPQQTAIPYRPIFIYRRLNCCPNSKKIKNLNVAPCRKLPKILKNQPHILCISSIFPNEYNEPIPVLWYWMLKEL